MVKYRKNRDLLWINDIVYSVIDNYYKKAETNFAAILWKKIVSSKVSKFTRAKGVKRKILFVNVLNSSIRQQLEFQKEDILYKINLNLNDKKKIKKIKFIFSDLNEKYNKI